MPVELSDLLSDERWVEVELGEHSFNVAYRPGSTSLLRQAELQKQMREVEAQSDADEVEQAKQLGKAFCEMVCNWDLVDKGKPLPITPEVVAGRLPGAIFNAIMKAIGEDAQSDREEKKVLSASSGAGSVPRGKRANVQNGTHSSEQAATWAGSRRGNS